MSSAPRQAQSASFHLTETKLKVLASLAEYFCLSKKDLVLLLYKRFTPSTHASIRRTINLLDREKLIDWRILPSRIRKIGNQPVIHGLSKKGIQIVKEENLETPSTRVFKPNADLLLPHEYEISQFHLRVTQLCDRNGWKLYWQQRDLQCTVNPDALFGITTDAGTLWYFLEVEKSNPSDFVDGKSALHRKIANYYKYFDSNACQKEWANFRKFRVIITQRNDERRQNLLKQLEKEYRNRMFWLTTEELYKADIGADIFLTPKDHARVAYSLLSP